MPPKDFAPIVPPDDPDVRHGEGYIPPGVLSFDYPQYPANSIAWGSVVVQLTVSVSGSVTSVDFLHSMPGFNNLVSDALKKWRFEAATFKGKAVASKTVIAFVFQTPTSNSN